MTQSTTSTVLWLPQEIYIHILAQLPVLRYLDSSIRSLINCASSNSFLRCAACTPALWRPHYLARYRTFGCDNGRREEERRARLGGDWRVMYLERRRLDRIAADIVEDLVFGERRSSGRMRRWRELDTDESRSGIERSDVASDAGALGNLKHAQHDKDNELGSANDLYFDGIEAAELVHECAREMVKLGDDVLDALAILQQAPVPQWFGPDKGPSGYDIDGDDIDIQVADHAIPRRYWAREMHALILRHDSVLFWVTLARQDVGGIANSETSLERGIAGLSAFFGVAYSEIKIMLDDLADSCRQYLMSLNVQLDPTSTDYDLTDLCGQICSFMRDQGFGPSGAGVALIDYFPHRFVSDRGRNIPLPLVYVFVCICRRLDIVASATDFPTRVIARVSSRDPKVNDILVDVYGSETKAILSINGDILPRLAVVGIPATLMQRSISPCGAESTLLRQTKNILSTFRGLVTVEDIKPAFYAAACAYTLMRNESVFVNELANLVWLDIKAIQLDVMCPALPNIRNRLEQACMNRLRLESEKNEVMLRSQMQADVKYFVGMMFLYRTDYQGSIGCIVGWKLRRQDSNGGRKMQTVYTVILYSDNPNDTDILEDRIIPIALNVDIIQGFALSIPRLGAYFEDVELDPSGRGRMVMCPAMRRLYPEDDDAGRRWVAKNDPLSQQELTGAVEFPVGENQPS